MFSDLLSDFFVSQRSERKLLQDRHGSLLWVVLDKLKSNGSLLSTNRSKLSHVVSNRMHWRDPTRELFNHQSTDYDRGFDK